MGGLHGEKFEELYSLFRKAEAAMKVVEEWEGDLIVPSINQLRYAGGHLLNFLSQDESVQNEEDLKKVKRHIQRAIFDSYDAGLSGILQYLNEFHKIFGALPELRKQIPEYDSFMDQADDAHDLIDKAVEKYDSRQEFYEECKPHWEKLRNIYRRLKRVTPTLDEIRRQRDSEQTT